MNGLILLLGSVALWKWGQIPASGDRADRLLDGVAGIAAIAMFVAAVAGAALGVWR